MWSDVSHGRARPSSTGCVMAGSWTKASMTSLRACLVVAIWLLLAGCGSPRTSIYAENADAVPYVLKFEGQGSSPILLSLPPEGYGDVLNEPGDIRGTVELMTSDCKVVSTATTDPGTVLITVAGGVLKVEPGVDLSRKPGTMLASDDTCPAQ